MRVCLHKKCKQMVTDELVACRPHWMGLPVEIRKGLLRAAKSVKRLNRKIVEVPENKPLMKVVTEQAHEYWDSLEKRNATA